MLLLTSIGRWCRGLHVIVSDVFEHVVDTILNTLKVLGGLQSVMVQQLELGQLMILQVFELFLDFRCDLLESLLLLEMEHLVLLLEERNIIFDGRLAEVSSPACKHVSQLLVFDLDLHFGRALLLTGSNKLLHLLN